MKKLIPFVILILMLMGFQYLVNCADPLETSGRNSLSPITPGDTIYSVDTVVVIDTVGTVDTVTVIDTVLIEVPGPIDSQFVCSRIACNQKEIVWMLRNQPGLFRLEFVVSMESDQPNQTLLINIGGQEFTWDPADDPEYIADLSLGQNATIQIKSKKPPALGHSIDICLTIRAL